MTTDEKLEVERYEYWKDVNGRWMFKDLRGTKGTHLVANRETIDLLSRIKTLQQERGKLIKTGLENIEFYANLERVRDSLLEYFEFLHQRKIISGSELKEARTIAGQKLTRHEREHPKEDKP